MALRPRPKLIAACTLLGASMLPLLARPDWHGMRAATPEVFVIALLTAGLALWGSFAGRVAWVLVLLRALLQALVTLLLLSEVNSYSRHASFLWLQAGVSLALTVAALWLLGSRAVRTLVWGTPADAMAVRPRSRLGTRKVLGGFGTAAVLLGSIEQAWIYQHLSLLEFVLRSLYLLLPWAGAWLLARLGRDRAVLTTLGALCGELTGELLSLVVSGASAPTVLANLLLPVSNLPALLVGLALAIFAPRRPLWQLGIALPLAQLLYRAAAIMLATSGGQLSWQAAVLAILTGLSFACSIYMFRRPEDAPEPPPTPPADAAKPV